MASIYACIMIERQRESVCVFYFEALQEQHEVPPEKNHDHQKYHPSLEALEEQKGLEPWLLVNPIYREALYIHAYKDRTSMHLDVFVPSLN